MRLILERALFAPQSDAEAMEILDLVTTVGRDLVHHALLTDPPYVLGGANQEIDTWLAGRQPAELNALRTVLTQGNLTAAGPRSAPSADPGAAPRRWHLAGSLTVGVERRPASDWGNLRLTLADALSLLREPVHLVLENDRHDLSFVCHLAGPTHGPVLLRLLEEPARIQTHGGGGGEAKRWLEALIDGPPTPEKWRRVLRAWVLFDQDSGDADARDPSRPAVEMRDLCEKVCATFGLGPSWVCLLRREIESYVPDSGLQAAALHQHAAFVRQVIAWRATPAFERHAWAIDLKLGLRGDFQAAVPKAVRDAVGQQPTTLAAHMLKVPFDALSPGEVAALASGLGKSRLNDTLREQIHAPTWAPDLPAEYDRGPAAQAPRALFVQSLFDRM